MPLNNIAKRSHSLEIDGIVTLLESTISSVSSARTIEDRLLLEARVLEIFNKIIQNKLTVPEVSVNSNCDKDNFSEEKSNLKYKTDLNMSKLEKLAQTYIDGYNTKVKELIEITGSLKRVRQKKAALDLWDREKAKWVLAEKFLNFDFLSDSDTGGTLLNIDTSEGIATLGIVSTEQIKPSSVYLSNGNGTPGNSDAAVTVENVNPASMFDEEPNSYFEYERLDSGPMKVSICCDFSSTEILNRIQIRPAVIPESLSFEIEDILFYVPGNKTISVKEQVGPKVKYENFIVKSVGNDIFWQLTFLPVSCNSVKIVCKQENSHLLNIPTTDNRLVTRKRYSIGIKHIEFQRLRFANEGGISSNALEIPDGLYVAESTSSVFPKNPNLFKATLDFSGNGGEDWDLDVFGFDENRSAKTIKLDGDKTNVFWRLYTKRNDDAFTNISSFTNEDISVNVSVISQLISLNQSPNKVPLPERPYNGNIGVYQPRICRRTDDPREAIQIATTPRLEPGEGFTINLPIELDGKGYSLLPEDMSLLVNNKELLAQVDSTGSAVSFEDIQNGTGTTDNIWAMDSDWKRIAVQHRRQLAPVTWKFPSQRLLLEERSDGYYAAFSDLFDPDKDRIRISYLPASLSTTSIKVPLLTKILNLNNTNIVASSVSFQSENDIIFTRTSIYVDVKDDSGTSPKEILYYVDETNGRVYLSKTISEASVGEISPVKLVYSHSNIKVLEDTNYEIWGENKKVKGIIISSDSVITKDREYSPNQEKVSDFVGIDIRTGAVLSKQKLFDIAASKKILDLPDNYIVVNSLRLSADIFEENPEIYPREVAYEDGKVEFLGLKNMDKEETIEIVSDTSGIVTFNLAAGVNYYAALGVVFEDTEVFKTLDSSLTSVGDYTVSAEGKVEVRVALSGSRGTLPGRIKYNYSYKDPSFISRGLYSVDYVNGVLFCAEDIRMSSNPIVKYKVANYKAEYDIVKKMDSWTYDPESNSVSIRTEQQSTFPINKRIKVYYFTRDNYTPIKELKNYFSPIFYNISFRFQ